MSNLTEDLVSMETSSSTPAPPPGTTSQGPANSTFTTTAFMSPTAPGISPTFPLDIIEANDLTSRANYAYALCLALGLVSACFLLYGLVQTYRAQRRLAWLDCLLWSFCGSQLLLLLLSLSSVAHRPNYLATTPLGCAALSFVVNLASVCGLLLLVLMAYILTFDPPSHAPLRRPGVCVALVTVTSVLTSVLLAGLRGLGAKEAACVIDPAESGVSYAAAKLCLSFLVPYVLLVGLLMGGCVRQWRSSGRFLSGSEEGPMFLAVAAVTFVCQLFYGVALVRAAGLAREEGGLGHRERAFLSVAEFVLFSGSCLSLLLVLLVHRPCREALRGAGRQLRDCCRGLGGHQTHRHIVAPHIEIADTQQVYQA